MARPARPFLVESLESRDVPATFTVTTTNDSAEAVVVGSLRWAIDQANATADADTIVFNIAPAGLATITPAAPLPALTRPVVIDGTTQPRGGLAAGTLAVELNGTSAGNTFGLTITGSDVTVRGLAVNRFAGGGVAVTGGARALVAGNYLGTDPTGQTRQTTAPTQVLIRGAATDARVGGDDAADGAADGVVRYRNVVAGSVQVTAFGGAFPTGTVVAGNYVGLAADGTTSLAPLGTGVTVDAGGLAAGGTTVVGGPLAGAANVISGFAAGAGTTGAVTVAAGGVTVRGNRVGTNAAGTAAVPNAGHGVVLTAAATAAEVRDNLISGNGGDGVVVLPSAGHTVAGNNVGTDAFGAATLGNAGWGVSLLQAADVTVDGNAVTGNALGGVQVVGPDSYGVRVTNNGIEVNSGGDGVRVEGGAGNVTVNSNTINTNAGDGVDLSGRLRLSANNVFAADGTPAGLAGGSLAAFAVGGVGYAAGAVDRAFDLNGTTGYVNTNDPDDNAGDLFVSLWVRFDTPVPDAGPRTLVSKQSADGSNVNVRVYRDADGRLKLLTRSAGVSAVVDSGLALPSGQFLFVAVAVRGTAVTFDVQPFVNPFDGGQSVGAVPSPRPSTGGTPLTLGAVLTGSTPSELLDGLLDDVQVRRGGTPTARQLTALYDDGRGSGIASNVIGVFPNGGAGVRVGAGARNTRIDGGNGITVNGVGGVVLEGGAGTANVSGVRVEGNFVGLDETPPAGGVRPAVLLSGNVTDARVAYNTIGRFAGPGVSLVAAAGQVPVRNRVVGNTFAGVTWPAVDLGGDGPTPNDPGDADAGPNNLQNAPAFSARPGPETRATGTVAGLPNAAYTVELYVLPADGSGAFPIGTVGVTTGPSGVGAFDATLAYETAAGDTFAATATDAAGNTSELAAAVPNPTAVTAFQVSRGQAQRSYVRYLDITFDVSPVGLTYGDRVRLVRADLNGGVPTVVALPAGALSVGGNVLTVDFGAQGIGGNRNSILGDGYYTVEFDLDLDGGFEVGRSFYRLLGDTNGDRRVDDIDLARFGSGTGVAFAPDLDVNGDGVVNGTDRLLARRSRGRELAAGLPLDD